MLGHPIADQRGIRARAHRLRLWLVRAGAGAVLLAVVLALAISVQAAKKSYGWDDDPVRLGQEALKVGRLQEAGDLFRKGIDSEWKLDRACLGLAEVLRRQGHDAEAEPLYRRALDEHRVQRNDISYPEASAGLGLVLLKLGRSDEALGEFQKALRDDKNNWNANYGTARILIAQKKFSDALPYLAKGKGLKGAAEGLDQYHYGMALAEVGLADMQAAEKDAMLALTLNPAASEYGTLVAQIYTARKAPTLAIDAYERALATPGVEPTAQVYQDLGVLYEGQMEFNPALQRYLRAIEIDSTFAPAYKSAARLYALGNQTDRAARFYLAYSNLVPKDPEGWSGQAEAFITLGIGKDALAAAQKAYSLDSTSAPVRLSLARALYMNNDLSQSEWLYKSVPDTTLYKASDWVSLGQIALSQKGFDRADELLSKAIKMEPGNPDAYSAKGKMFLSRQKPDSAVVYYQKSLAINPRSLLSRVNLAVAYLQMRKPGDGANMLRSVIAEKPDWAPAHTYLGQALLMSDSLTAGLAEYRKAIELEPNNAGALRGAGFIYLKRGDFASAEAVLLKATAADPRSADGWASLGSAQAGLRKIDEAIASFQKALEISPNHEGALRGLEAMKKAKEAAGAR